MLYQKVYNTIEQNGLIPSGKTVIAAVSGGADSVCLFLLLLKLSKELGFKLECAHLNHNLRAGESDGDAEFVKTLCKSHNVTLHYKSVDVLALSQGKSIEEAAREARYGFFYTLINEQNAVVATAHTQNDNVETFFINLARGSGSRGLAAIPASRDGIIRPMLDVTRKEVIEFLGERGQNFCTDSTNSDTDYLRNFIRHNIVSEFEKRDDIDIFKSVSRAIENIKTDQSYLQKIADEVVTNSAIELLELDDAILFRVLYSRLYNKFKIKLDSAHFAAVKSLLKKPNSKEQIRGDVFAINSRGMFCFDKIIKADSQQVLLTTDQNEFNGKRVLIKNTKEIYNTLTKATIDCDKICNNLHIRHKKDGDVFYSSKRSCTTKLKKLLINDKVDALTKQSLAVICDDKNVVFVEGYGADKRYLANKDTKNKICIEICGILGEHYND